MYFTLVPEWSITMKVKKIFSSIIIGCFFSFMAGSAFSIGSALKIADKCAKTKSAECTNAKKGSSHITTEGTKQSMD